MLELWWQGLPPGVRGKVWIRAIGNELNISKGMYILHGGSQHIFYDNISAELYEISLRRCNNRLSDISIGIGRERSGCKAIREFKMFMIILTYVLCSYQ